jgi:m7GpppX diphosphatase
MVMISILIIKKKEFYKQKLTSYKIQFQQFRENSVHAVRKNKLYKEDYEKYRKIRDMITDDHNRWAHNIIDGKSEVDRVIHTDKEFTLVQGKNSTPKNKEKFHLIAWSNNKDIMTLRDLRGDHVNMLENIKRIGLEKIKSKYGINENQLNVFVHYPPQVWLFHVHFYIVGTNHKRQSVEYSHLLDNVIFNLKLDSDYYKKINMNVKVTKYRTDYSTLYDKIE